MSDITRILFIVLMVETLVIGSIGILALRRRKVPGAITFLLLGMASICYTFGYGMELISTTMEQVDFWGKFQYMGISFIPFIWTLFALGFTNENKSGKKKPYLIVIMLLVPVATLLLRWTSEYQSLMYGAKKLVEHDSLTVLVFEKGPWYYFFQFYFIISVFVTIVIYLRALKKANGYVKRQIRIILIVCILPLIPLFLNVLGANPLGLDYGPFIAILNYSLFTIGIFRYHMMHIIPISRETIFDWISDGVIVIDQDKKLADYNYAARKIFPDLNQRSIGDDLASTLNSYSDFASLLKECLMEREDGIPFCTDKTELDGECIFSIYREDSEQGDYYKLRMKDLKDKKTKLGTILLITNVTKERETRLQLEQAARIDGLTGIFNRTYLITQIEKEIQQCKESHKEAALILFDIDHFKRVNDTFGHQAGDYVIRELVDTVIHQIRMIDIIGRYGGEEFIFFLPETSIEVAMKITERIRHAFETKELTWEGKKISVTASFGIAVMDREIAGVSTFDDMVKKADLALYLAKEGGRNRIEVYSEDTME